MTAAERTQIDQLVRQEQGRLLNFIRKRVGDESDAEDIMQDVLYQLTIGFNDIRSVSKITSWLFTVTRNRITDYFRKKKPDLLSDKLITSKHDAEEGPLMMEDILPALTRSPEDEYMRSVIWDAIEEALDELPEEQRQVFVYNEFDDMSFKEISELTCEGINTLLSRKRYAIIYLRKQLKELYEQLKS